MRLALALILPLALPLALSLHLEAHAPADTCEAIPGGVRCYARGPGC